MPHTHRTPALRMSAVMIDIEGLGKTATTPILSIGAVRFDPHSDWIGDHFHTHVSLANSFCLGFKPDASTVLWWMEQPESARLYIAAGQLEAAPVIDALQMLAEFIQAGESRTVWAKGTNYDIAALEHHYAAVGLPTPWGHRAPRDMRELVESAPDDITPHNPNPPHHALWDALHQARWVQAIYAANR